MAFVPNRPTHLADNKAPRFIPALLTVLVHVVLLFGLYLGMTSQKAAPVEVELWDGDNLATSLEAISTPTETLPVPQEAETEPTPNEAKANSPTTQTTHQNTIEHTADIRTPDTEKTPNKPTEKNNTPRVTQAKPNNQPTSTVDSATRTAALERFKKGSGGTSSNKTNADDASAYIARVKILIYQHVKAEKEKHTGSVAIRLAPNGSVINKSILYSSGNAAWDANLLAAIGRASPFPTPVHQSALRGINLNFSY
ncbi:TonB family protein [Hydromonas duriensis]|uniref:TonB family protein n=1 Tax=Hydromonas duriensis TaxID=1527608 RepID=A0A4R6YC29_9BURK|nr:TonB family protein [Hydromonas duriensis]TDR33174.1 TonB family protein [Hydromonas duriensis]